MLAALPEGFPTPEPRDGKGLAKALGDAAARWMRGDYAEAIGRIHAAVVIAATERASNERIDRLERVVARLEAWFSARQRGSELALPPLDDGSNGSITLPDFTSVDPKTSVPETMTLESRDLEIVDSPRALPTREAQDVAGFAKTPRKIAISTTRAPLSTTMQEASRPTIPVVERTTNDPLPKRPHGTTLPQGELPGSSTARAGDAVRRDDEATLVDDARVRPTLPSDAPAATASANDDAKSTRRFVPPSTRRPAEGELYPPVLPSDADEGDES